MAGWARRAASQGSSASHLARCCGACLASWTCRVEESGTSLYIYVWMDVSKCLITTSRLSCTTDWPMISYICI